MERNDALCPRDGTGGAPARQLSRREALLLLGSLALACPLVLSGCGYDDEDRKAVRDSIDSELTKLTTLSASELLGDSVSGIEKLGISADDFLDAFFKDCSWSVGDVSFESSVATAKVDLTCRSLETVKNALRDAYSSLGQTDESKLYAVAGEALIKSVHSASAESRSADVTLSKKDGSWIVDDAGHEALVSLILGSRAGIY